MAEKADTRSERPEDHIEKLENKIISNIKKLSETTDDIEGLKTTVRKTIKNIILLGVQNDTTKFNTVTSGTNLSYGDRFIRSIKGKTLINTLFKKENGIASMPTTGTCTSSPLLRQLVVYYIILCRLGDSSTDLGLTLTPQNYLSLAYIISEMPEDKEKLKEVVNSCKPQNVVSQKLVKKLKLA